LWLFATASCAILIISRELAAETIPVRAVVLEIRS